MGYSAGLLNCRVQLQEPVRARDGMGGSVPNFVTRATVWAAVEPLSGRELWQARQAQADVTTRITLRPYPGLAPDWRILLAGSVYQIDGVIDPRVKGEILQLMCKEVL